MSDREQRAQKVLEEMSVMLKDSEGMYTADVLTAFIKGLQRYTEALHNPAPPPPSGYYDRLLKDVAQGYIDLYEAGKL